MKVKFAGNEAKVPDFLMLAERRLLQSVKCFNKLLVIASNYRCSQLQGGAR